MDREDVISIWIGEKFRREDILLAESGRSYLFASHKSCNDVHFLIDLGVSTVNDSFGVPAGCKAQEHILKSGIDRCVLADLVKTFFDSIGI